MATRWFIFWPLLRKQTNYAAVQKRYSFCEDLHGCLSGYLLRTQKGCGYTEIDAHSQTIQSNVTGTVLCYKKLQKIRTNFFAPYFTWYSTQRIVNTLLRMVHVLKGVFICNYVRHFACTFSFHLTLTHSLWKERRARRWTQGCEQWFIRTQRVQKCSIHPELNISQSIHRQRVDRLRPQYSREV